MTIRPWLSSFVYIDLDKTGIQAPEVGRAYDETSRPKICIHRTQGPTLAGAERAFAAFPPHAGAQYRDDIRHQYLPLDKCSFSLRGSESDDEFVVQVEWVGFSESPPGPEECDWFGKKVIAPIAEAIKCPLVAASQGFHGPGEGIVLASVNSPIRFKTEAELRAFSGIMGHQHAPPPDEHWDPGAIDIARIIKAAKTALQPVVPPAVKEILMDQAINFMVRRASNGAVLFVMRNMDDPYRPMACFGVDGGSFGGFVKAGVKVCEGLTDGDFSFFERYRIDNIPEHETVA